MKFQELDGGHKPHRSTEEETKKKLFALFRQDSEKDLRTNGVGILFTDKITQAVRIIIGLAQENDHETVEDRRKNLALSLRQLVELHDEGIITQQELEFGTNYWLDHYQPTIEQAWDTVAVDPMGPDYDC